MHRREEFGVDLHLRAELIHRREELIRRRKELMRRKLQAPGKDAGSRHNLHEGVKPE